MKDAIHMARAGFILALLVVSSACVLEAREGFYDRDHHRYWHEHAWHDCVERDEHCRGFDRP
jgi:hypothetical protein